MAADEEEPGEQPEYNVYRGGSGGGRRARAESKGPARERPKKGDGAGPDYKVYKPSRNPLSRLRGAADLGALKERLSEGRRSERREQVGRLSDPGGKPLWRKVLRYALIGAGLWILLSVVLFAVSAQIQKGKLNDQAAEMLGGGPLLALSPQTILVMGTDARPEGTQEPGAETNKQCIEGAANGDPSPPDCLPFRADTLMLIRAGGGKFEKLSIPRDTFAEIPGFSAQKINAGYALGGAALQIETVENFLGIEVDHALIVDFAGFEDLIDAVGGVPIRITAKGGFKSKVGGGAGQGGITLELDRDEHTLDGQEALVYARTRKNLKDPSENDLDRARRQQEVLSGLKSRLTSPTRLPYNFLFGPRIAWNAPKAMVTDMGGWTLPQVAFAAAIGGDSKTAILGSEDASATGSGDIVVPLSQCERAVKKFLGEPGPEPPACSPAG